MGSTCLQPSPVSTLNEAIKVKDWGTVGTILKSLPTSLPKSGNLQHIESFLGTTRSVIDLLDQCIDPTISYKSAVNTVDGLLFQASVTDYLSSVLQCGGNLTFITDRISQLFSHLCISVYPGTARSKIGASGAVASLTHCYNLDPSNLSVIDALTVLACGHIDNAVCLISNGAIGVSISVLVKTTLTESSRSLFEGTLRLLATVAICVPDECPSERKALVPAVLSILREATETDMHTVAEQALTVFANAADCVLREGEGFAFQNAWEVVKASIDAWTAFKTIEDFGLRAVWTLVALMHIDESAREFALYSAHKIQPLLDTLSMPSHTYVFLKQILNNRDSVFNEKSARFLRGKPWSRQDNKSLPTDPRSTLQNQPHSDLPPNSSTPLLRSATVKKNENRISEEVQIPESSTKHDLCSDGGSGSIAKNRAMKRRSQQLAERNQGKSTRNDNSDVVHDTIRDSMSKEQIHDSHDVKIHNIATWLSRSTFDTQSDVPLRGQEGNKLTESHIKLREYSDCGEETVLVDGEHAFHEPTNAHTTTANGNLPNVSKTKEDSIQAVGSAFDSKKIGKDRGGGSIRMKRTRSCNIKPASVYTDDEPLSEAPQIQAPNNDGYLLELSRYMSSPTESALPGASEIGRQNRTKDGNIVHFEKNWNEKTAPVSSGVNVKAVKRNRSEPEPDTMCEETPNRRHTSSMSMNSSSRIVPSRRNSLSGRALKRRKQNSLTETETIIIDD